MQNQNESGRSMIEMLGVLSIMGVIMYGAVAGINFGIEMYKINATYNEIEEISRGILDLYSWSSNFSGVSIKVLCENDVVSQCGSNNMTATNQWAGPITVASTNNDQDFAITYENVPSLACERLKSETGLTNVCPPRGMTCVDRNTMTFTLKPAVGCSGA